MTDFTKKFTDRDFYVFPHCAWGVVLSLLLSQKDFSSTLHKFQKWIDKKSFFNSSVLSFFFGSSIQTTFLLLTLFRLINDGLNFIKIVNSNFWKCSKGKTAKQIQPIWKKVLLCLSVIRKFQRNTILTFDNLKHQLKL